MTTVFAGLQRALFRDPSLTEAIEYGAYQGAARTMQARVERQPQQVESTMGRRSTANVVWLWIANDAGLGMTAIQEGFDTVTLKMRLGDAAPTVLRVTKILAQNEVDWKLEASA